MYLEKTSAIVYEVEVNSLVPLVTPLISGWTISLTLIPPSGGIYGSQFLVDKLREVHNGYALSVKWTSFYVL